LTLLFLGPADSIAIVRVDLPDRHGRLHILEIHSKGKPFEDNVNLDEIARDTLGFSGAHLESLMNEAAILSMRKAKTTIGQDELREAIDKVIMGERLDRRPTEEEMSRIAHHEVGHGIVSEVLRPGSVSTITVMSRGQALGYTRQSQEEDYHIYTSNQLQEQIAILLAGSVAEVNLCLDQNPQVHPMTSKKPWRFHANSLPQACQRPELSLLKSFRSKCIMRR